jgi:cytochrome c5
VNLSAVKSLRSASLQNVIEVKALSFAYCVEKPAKSHSTRTFQILESDSRPHPYGARIFRKICKICKHLSVLLVPLSPRNPLAS